MGGWPPCGMMCTMDSAERESLAFIKANSTDVSLSRRQGILDRPLTLTLTPTPTHINTTSRTDHINTTSPTYACTVHINMHSPNPPRDRLIYADYVTPARRWAIGVSMIDL